MQILHTTNLRNYRYQVQLDGEVFNLSLYYNRREGAWYISVSDVNDAPIVSGSKLVLGSSVFSRIASRNRPVGEIICYDTTGKGTEPDELTIGDLVQLLYVELADV